MRVAAGAAHGWLDRLAEQQHGEGGGDGQLHGLVQDHLGRLAARVGLVDGLALAVQLLLEPRRLVLRLSELRARLDDDLVLGGGGDGDCDGLSSL